MNSHVFVEEYARRREKNAAARRARIESLEARVPAFAQLRLKRNALYAKRARLEVLGQDTAGLKAEAASLDAELTALLKEEGLPDDWLERHYDCPICKDKGFTPQGGMCSCLTQKIKEAEFHEYDLSVKTPERTFECYNMNLFSDDDTTQGMSPRTMAQVRLLEMQNYCKNYPQKNGNLLFYGGPGTGKTYMASCIVNELRKTNNDLIYVSAPNLIQMLFEDIRAQSGIKNSYRNAFKTTELLIIDDLGTEADTDFTRSAFSEIIDERLITERSTIITTNYSPKVLTGRYPERLCSRINYAFQVLPFTGEDLRRSTKSL